MQNTTTVWIIEDNTKLRNYLCKYLNMSKDLSCTGTFPNCETALGALGTEPPPHILLIDLGLPGMSGIEGIRRFKQRIPGVEPLVLTVDDSREKVFEAIQAGASGYLLKTDDVEDIINGCRRVAKGEASLDGNVARMMLDSLRTKPAKKKATKKDDAGHNLTDRELEILQLLSEGYYVKQIEDQLGISSRTVKFHCANLYRKLNACSQRTAIVEARRRDII
ncbi:MAG: response regulator transcription factor [Pontiellaceae bacterium]|nr:response regulator transcription factor [Pontiellaceae bacterium]MBN2783230.1 response regulator transcription factor [Pontiellaceae bacterium]